MNMDLLTGCIAGKKCVATRFFLLEITRRL
jgi:hypothetical protein